MEGLVINKIMEQRQENSPELKKLIRDNAGLFWYIRDDKKENLPHEVVIEFILNYGNIDSCRRLFEILGLKYVADIFYEQVAPGRRINYFPMTAHFFDLYFQRNAYGVPPGKLIHHYYS
jgi:hypothetical protein